MSFFFLLVKTDEVQLILASAVIPMPGACVFPTTTSRGSAAAGDSGRGSTQLRRTFKRESREQVTLGYTGISRRDRFRSGNCVRKVGCSNPLGEVDDVVGIASLSVRSLDSRQQPSSCP